MADAYLDSNIVIRFAQAPRETGEWLAHELGRRLTAVGSYVISDLVRMECKVRPLARGDERLVREMEAFLASARFVCVGFPPATFDRAAEIRARFGYRTPDALHLAAAAEADCGFFVTADRRLSGFTDIPIVLLRPE